MESKQWMHQMFFEAEYTAVVARVNVKRGNNRLNYTCVYTYQTKPPSMRHGTLKVNKIATKMLNVTFHM